LCSQVSNAKCSTLDVSLLQLTKYSFLRGKLGEWIQPRYLLPEVAILWSESWEETCNKLIGEAKLSSSRLKSRNPATVLLSMVHPVCRFQDPGIYFQFNFFLLFTNTNWPFIIRFFLLVDYVFRAQISRNAFQNSWSCVCFRTTCNSPCYPHVVCPSPGVFICFRTTNTCRLHQQPRS
jgi:hypothetical protein